MKFNIKKPVYALTMSSLCLLGGGLQATVDEPLSEYNTCFKSCTHWYGGGQDGLIHMSGFQNALFDHCYYFLRPEHHEPPENPWKPKPQPQPSEKSGNSKFKDACKVNFNKGEKFPISEAEKKEDCSKFCLNHHKFNDGAFMHYNYDLPKDPKDPKW